VLERPARAVGRAPDLAAVKPRGHRYLLARACTPQDREGFRMLAARMVQG
jgi:hypothetical protein